MKEFIEKLIGRLEEQAEQYRNRGFEHEKHGYSAMADKYYAKQCSYSHSIEIVNELAEEYKGGWISTKEPPKVFMLSEGKYIPFLVFDDVIWHPYIAYYDGKEWYRSTYYTIEPIFWQKLPSRPYKEGE